jgi:hypothetical protein
MQNDIDTAEFFNRLSLSNFEDMAGKNGGRYSEKAGQEISRMRRLTVNQQHHKITCWQKSKLFDLSMIKVY